MDPYMPQVDPNGLPPALMMGMGQPPMGAGPIPPMMDPSMMGMDPSMMGMPMQPMMPPQPGPMELLSPVPPDVPEYVPPGPTPPAWYVEPKKPKKADIQEEADNERAAHADRIALAMQMIRRLNQEINGIFEKDKDLVEINEVERGQLTDLRDEHDAYCGHISSMDWSAVVPLKDSIDREETIAKEDAIHYYFECYERQHAMAGNASLKWALPDMVGKYGMICASLMVDPLNDECGLRFQMLDPATVFPIYEGGRGLARVYRIYQATAAQVIGSFFDEDGTVEKKVKGVATYERRYDQNYVGEVVEYWDRAHVMVLFDGKEVFYRKHDYARVPFVIKYGGFGQQAFTQTTNITNDDGTHIRNFGSSASDLRREDLMRIAQPFLLRRVKAHDLEEAIMGLYVTALRRQLNPEWLYKLGLASFNDGAPTFQAKEGGVRVARDDDDGAPVPPVLTPDVINAVNALTTQNKQTGMASGVIMGQMPGGQTSGSAIDILGQAGLEKWRPLVRVVEEFLTELAEFTLQLIKEWGGILGMEPNIGVIEVPRRNPNPLTGDSPAHELTPEILRRVGIRAKIELRRFNPSGLTNLANGLAVLYNMGILDKRTLIDLTGITNNPEQILDRIDEEMLDSVPEIKQEKTIRQLWKKAHIAEQRGDFGSAEEAMNRAYFVASQMQHRMMYGMPTDMQGLMPGMPVPGQVPTQQTVSVPGMDTQGGRPPGGGAPQPMGPGGPLMAG